MPQWGKDPFAVDNKPKYLPDDETNKYSREDAYATNAGWVMRAGSPATGNGNVNAAPEILVAIRGLAGISANAGIGLEQHTSGAPGNIIQEVGGDDILLEMGSGLGTPTITDVRFITSAPDAGSSKTVTVEVTWDEAVTVASANPQLTVNNGNEGSGTGRTCVLTYSSGISSANRLRFTATNITVAEDDVLTVGGASGSLALNSATISDTAIGGTTVPASLDMSGVSAVTQTVTA
jgi:hypothetical protein